MRTILAVCGATLLLFAIIPHSHASIVAGPIVNPANGHEYFLLAPNTWSASEAEAENLGGTLAIIRNADEQKWIFSTFGDYNGTNRNLWIGLHRQWQNAPLTWVTDERPDYSNWSSGNPDNAGGSENCVHIYNPKDVQAGKWNDLPDNSSTSDPLCGVVEVPGKSQEKSLNENEKSLIGAWYNNGDPAQPCWIASTDNMLFFIDQNKDASRAVYTPDGLIFSPKWKQHVEIVGDKILWSRGNWWSRNPAGYKNEKASSDK